MPGGALSSSNLWRWSYPRPADVASHGLEAARVSQGLYSERDRQKSGREQLERKRTSGFPGHEAESAHSVVWKLRKRGYSHTVCQLAGHLVSPGGEWNFQGNRRLARWMGRCDRTVRRARAVLERDGWIRSCLLVPGEKISGQRAAVIRPQVVRDVSKLQRLARVRMAVRAPHEPRRERRRPSAAERPAPVRTDITGAADAGLERVEATPEQLDELARARPEFAAFFSEMAAAKRARVERPVKPPPEACNPAPTTAEIDAWDYETARMEHELRERQRRERDPPS